MTVNRTKLRVPGRVLVGILIPAALAAGCSTKGYVRSQVDGLRTEMNQQDSAIRTELGEVRNSAEDARTRAEVASTNALEARALAIGDVEYKSVASYTTHFNFDSDVLDDDSRSALDQVSQQIQANPTLLVDIYGFTDPAGSEQYNLQLGQRRADAVLRYLADQAPPGQLRRFAAVSYGEAKPASEATGERSSDRRVEVALIEQTPRTTGVSSDYELKGSDAEREKTTSSGGLIP